MIIRFKSLADLVKYRNMFYKTAFFPHAERDDTFQRIMRHRLATKIDIIAKTSSDERNANGLNKR